MLGARTQNLLEALRDRDSLSAVLAQNTSDFIVTAP